MSSSSSKGMNRISVRWFIKAKLPVAIIPIMSKDCAPMESNLWTLKGEYIRKGKMSSTIREPATLIAF